MQSRHSEALILLVDDDRLMRDMLSAVLSDIGAEVATANHGQDALVSLTVCRPNLILCDGVMPNLDGFALCQRLKQDPNYRDIPFAILSALSKNIAERSAEVGADDYFSKSGNETLLRLRVRTLLDISLAGEPRPASLESFGGARLLLVSPSASLRSQFSVQLAPSGLRVEECQGFAGLLKSLSGPPADLVVLDAQQDEKSLADLAVAVRTAEAWWSVPILVLAEKGDEATLEGLETLVSDWVVKPLEKKEVHRRVQLLLRSTRPVKA